MEMLLSTIQFCEEDGQAAASALRLRKNAEEACPFPEWQRGMPRGTGSCTAYAVSDVEARAGRITITARFLIIDAPAEPVTVFVRAVQPDIAAGPPVWNTHVNVLGEVEERELTIGGAENTQTEVFTIRNQRVTDWGVGIFNVIWNWQFRMGHELSWTTFDRSEHLVYCLLKPPTAPWSQHSAGDLLLPWTDVLDFACDWALQAKTEDQAAADITRRLFSMGPLWFEYNCITFLPAYVQILDITGASYFNCMSFLRHLRFNNVNRYIICSDCAAIVSTFANILGCDLWQAKLQTPGLMFKVNEIFAIGGFRWQLPCNFPGFSYHELAWTGNATAEDPIYDACLAVDGSPDPADPIRIPVLPLKMKLGRRGQGLYRDKLVTMSDWLIARPNPQRRERRLPIPALPVQIQGALAEGGRKKTSKKEIAFVRQHFDLQFPTIAEGSGDMFSIGRFNVRAFPDWQISLIDRQMRHEDAPGFLFSIWRRPDSLGMAAKVDVYECSSSDRAQEMVMAILVNSHLGVVAVSRTQEEGVTTYSWEGSENVIMVHGNLIILVSRADKLRVPARELAGQIDRYFASQ